MAVLERSYCRPAGFRKLFKWSKILETPSPHKASIDRNNSDNSIPTDCSVSHSKNIKVHHDIDSDSETMFNSSPKREISLFRCFGTRTSQGKSRRSKTSNECLDSAESNMTIRTAQSFYSVISLTDENLQVGFSKSRNSQLNDNNLLLSGGTDDSSDFLSVDGDDFENDENSKKIPAAQSTIPLCACGFLFHEKVYYPEFPLFTRPGIVPNSHDEALAIANACSGRWETIVERSESLDPQYRCIGLGMIKRAVMNRLAIPLTMFLEENDTLLHCWIHTPLGIRHMRSNLLHQESIDYDPDAGKWTGVTHITDFSIPWFCNGKPVRAIQQRRTNPKIGTCVETRCILPDSIEGKIMLFQFLMIPSSKREKDELKADRILKYLGPKID